MQSRKIHKPPASGRTLRIGIVFGAIILLLATNSVQSQSRQSLTDELDIFAAEHLSAVQALSFRDRVEYCGLFGFDEAGNLVATKAKRGKRDSCEPEVGPPGLEVLASYHTHGAYSPDSDTETPSVFDLAGDIDEDIDGYVATPGGRLWVNLVEEQLSVLLCGPGCLPDDPAFRECPAMLPASEYTLEELRDRADNDTGEC